MTEKCPVLILGNKIDIPTAASEEQIKEYFNLHPHTTGKKNVSNILVNNGVLLYELSN